MHRMHASMCACSHIIAVQLRAFLQQQHGGRQGAGKTVKQLASRLNSQPGLEQAAEAVKCAFCLMLKLGDVCNGVWSHLQA